MGLHQTLKHCTQCGHAAELVILVCPKCKKIFEENQSQPAEFISSPAAELSPAEIIANMQEKKKALESESKNTGKPHEHSEDRTMSQMQLDAISQERMEFNRRWKELSGKNGDDGKSKRT